MARPIDDYCVKGITTSTLSGSRHVVLRLADGRVMVGDILKHNALGIVFRPWGARYALRIPVTSILTAAPTRAMSWARMKAIGVRQKNGEFYLNTPPTTAARRSLRKKERKGIYQ